MNKSEGGTKAAIPVTGELIEKAVVRDSSHCVIADAIRAHMPDATFVSVDLQTIRFSRGKTKRRYTYLTPRQCQVTLLDFDQGNPIEPFAFRLGSPVHIATAKPRAKKAGRGTQRPYKPRSVRKNGADIGGVVTVLDGKAPPANAALATGKAGTGKAKIRQYGLRQLKP